ncbi:hypothetical protein ACFPRL_27525 [Pseudoclavibacter helvolus]
MHTIWELRTHCRHPGLAWTPRAPPFPRLGARVGGRSGNALATREPGRNFYGP